MLALVFITASISVCIGFCVAVFVERRSKANEGRGANSDSDGDRAGDTDADVDCQLVRELLASLQELTAEVDQNVDKHTSRVSSISEEFELESSPDSRTVLKAAKSLIEANKQLVTDLVSAKAEIRVQRQQIQSYMTEARTDELTGLSNRRVFEKQLRRCLAAWKNQETPFSLMLVDVDHFKRFNDYHGHQTGDEILREIACVLDSSARGPDIVTRYGGEEFAIILPETSLETCKLIGERVREAVAGRTISVGGSQLHVTVSVGLAQASGDEDAESLVQRADKSLYASKNAGRNCSYFHDGQKVVAIDHLAADRSPCAV